MSIPLVPSVSLRKDLEQVVAEAQTNLHLAMPYLSERGITEQVAKKFRLGVHEHGLPNYNQYIGRMTIPYLTQAGVATIRYRSLDGTSPKFLSMSGDQARLFNVNALFTDSETLAICEGEFDAIIVNDYAAVPAIGVQGVAAWKPSFNRLVKGYRTILVIGDGDEAGERFADETAGKIGGTPVVLPDGEDCNSFYLKHDSFGLIDLLGV